MTEGEKKRAMWSTRWQRKDRHTRESLSSAADRTRRSAHTCVYSTFSFSKESHYSSLASRGHLTINRDKHWWPLMYPWQWPSAEQNQTLALSSKPSWEWRGAPCAGQMASGEGDDGAQWSLAAEIPLRKLGLMFVSTEAHQESLYVFELSSIHIIRKFALQTNVLYCNVSRTFQWTATFPRGLNVSPAETTRSNVA